MTNLDFFYNHCKQHMQVKQQMQHPITAENFKSGSEIEQPQIHQALQRTRNEEPVRINADDQSQCILCIYILSIFLPLIVIIIIAIFAIPDASIFVRNDISLEKTNLAGCNNLLYRSPNDNQYLSCFKGTNITGDANSSVGMYIRDLTNLNQFLLFYLDLSPWAKSTNNKQQVFNQYVSFTIYVAQYNQLNNKTKVVNIINSQNLSISYSAGILRKHMVFLGFQTKVSAGQQFYVQLTFQSNTVLISQENFIFKIKTINQSFTIYTIILRVVFFILSVIVYIKYVSTLIKIPKHVISIEQKGVQLIGVLTILFNDQLFFITVLWPNPFTSFLSAFFIWNLLFGYFNLWISFLIRILYEQPDTTTLQTKKPFRIALLVLFYLVGLGFSAAFAIIQTNEYPMITMSSIESPAFKFFLISILLCFVFGIVYLFYLYTKVFCNKPIRSYRHNVFLYLTLCFIAGVIIVTLMGSFDVFDYSGALIFFTFAFFNFYTYFLMYLYSPTKQQIKRYSQRMKQSWAQNENKQDFGEGKSVNIELQQEIQIPSEKEQVRSGGSSERRKKRLRDIRRKDRHTIQEKRENGKFIQGQSVEKIKGDDEFVEKQHNKSISLDSEQMK